MESQRGRKNSLPRRPCRPMVGQQRNGNRRSRSIAGRKRTRRRGMQILERTCRPEYIAGLAEKSGRCRLEQAIAQDFLCSFQYRRIYARIAGDCKDAQRCAITPIKCKRLPR